MKNMSHEIEISLVIPVLNEAENINELADLIEVSFKEIPSYEVIWVDDGSKDNSLEILEDLNKKYPNQKYISLMRTSGQSTALMAGIDSCHGKYIATLDGDIQNFPEDVVKMYKILQEGKYDMMVGWRKKRWQEKVIRRIPSIIANFCIQKAFRAKHLHDAGCPVKIARADIFKEIKLYGELHRFIAYIAYDLGAKIGEIEVKHAQRKYGASHYGLSRTFKVIVDIFNLKLLMMRKTTPTQIMAPLSFITCFIAFVAFVASVIMKFTNHINITGNPLFIISVMGMLIGIQFFVFGFLGELIIRTYYEGNNKKTYLVRNSNI